MATNTKPAALQCVAQSIKLIWRQNSDHWFTIRKAGNQWFNLNSTQPNPSLIPNFNLPTFANRFAGTPTVFSVIGPIPAIRGINNIEGKKLMNFFQQVTLKQFYYRSYHSSHRSQSQFFHTPHPPQWRRNAAEHFWCKANAAVWAGKGGNSWAKKKEDCCWKRTGKTKQQDRRAKGGGQKKAKGVQGKEESWRDKWRKTKATGQREWKKKRKEGSGSNRSDENRSWRDSNPTRWSSRSSFWITASRNKGSKAKRKKK